MIVPCRLQAFLHQVSALLLLRPGLFFITLFDSGSVLVFVILEES